MRLMSLNQIKITGVSEKRLLAIKLYHKQNCCSMCVMPRKANLLKEGLFCSKRNRVKEPSFTLVTENAIPRKLGHSASYLVRK